MGMQGILGKREKRREEILNRNDAGRDSLWRDVARHPRCTYGMYFVFFLCVCVCECMCV